ncbi:retrovirus-related pol polyprotein from transposon TNT 1-94 [Tanacetum coccineum]
MTQKNNKPYVDASRLKQTEVDNIKKHAVKQNTKKSDKTMLPSTGRVSSINASRSKPRGNTKNDRIQRTLSRSKKNKVEAHHWKFKSSANKNNHVSDCNANVKNKIQKRKVAKSAKQKVQIEWKPTGKIFTAVGLRWRPIGRMFNMEGKICPIIKTSPATIVPSRNRLHTIMIPAVAPNEETRRRYSIAKNSLIRAHINSYGNPFNPPNFAFVRSYVILEQSSSNFGFLGIVDIVLWYLDSGCSKHMTRHHDKLINFASKFIETVRFGNDHFVAIIGYGDLQIGNILISRVYYVEGLGHNLFSIGQFCDSDLEVTFKKHTCFVRNLEGVDLLSGSHGSNLYTISMVDMMKSYPICLLSKALKIKSWLWHCCLSHLNFGTINQLAKHGLVKGLPKLKYTKDHLCSACQIGPELHGLTFGHISSGLVLNQAASTSTNPLTKNDWDLLFQPMFHEYFKPPSAVSTSIYAATLLPPDTVGASSSSSIDKDLPLYMSTFYRCFMCYFHAFLAKEELENYKEAMEQSRWIEAMQEEIHEFERLEV